jgi:hypothetical protein
MRLLFIISLFGSFFIGLQFGSLGVIKMIICVVSQICILSYLVLYSYDKGRSVKYVRII